MHPRRDARSDRFRGENGAQRKAGCKGLGNQNNVGPGRKLLIGEVAASAAGSALNFVSIQKSAVLNGKRPSAVPEFVADRIDSAFALERFQKNATNGVIKFRFEVGDVVETHELRARNGGREGQPVLFREGYANSAKRAAMKRILQCQEAMLLCNCPCRLVRLPPVEPR